MKSLILRVLGGAVAAAALLTVPATATASESSHSSPFRLAVPGVTATGAYEQTRLTVTVKVTGRQTCGILQLTTIGPADGVEWYTAGALCGRGTAAIRTEVNRLPSSAGALPSIRLCNGDSLALAEGVDCDDWTPPAGAKAGFTATG